MEFWWCNSLLIKIFKILPCTLISYLGVCQLSDLCFICKIKSNNFLVLFCQLVVNIVLSWELLSQFSLTVLKCIFRLSTISFFSVTSTPFKDFTVLFLSFYRCMYPFKNCQHHFESSLKLVLLLWKIPLSLFTLIFSRHSYILYAYFCILNYKVIWYTNA